MNFRHVFRSPIAAFLAVSIPAIAVGYLVTVGAEPSRSTAALDEIQTDTSVELWPVQMASAMAENNHAAEFHWAMNCRGCHGVEGEGSQTAGVPPFTDMSQFMRVAGGREFLIRVPGVAWAPLTDAELADVLNWIVENFVAEGRPEEWEPFSAAEVGELRRSPLTDNLNETRRTLLDETIRPRTTVEQTEL